MYHRGSNNSDGGSQAMLKKAEIWHGPFLEAHIRGAHGYSNNSNERSQARGRATLKKGEIWHGPFLEAQIRGAHRCLREGCSR